MSVIKTGQLRVWDFSSHTSMLPHLQGQMFLVLDRFEYPFERYKDRHEVRWHYIDLESEEVMWRDEDSLMRLSVVLSEMQNA